MKAFPHWEDLVTIGKCVKPHGLNGEMRVKPITDFPERFEQTEKVFAHQQKDPVRPLSITAVRGHHGGLLVQFQGVDSIDKANALRGHFLAVPDDELVELEEDEYWHWELEGLAAFTPAGEPLGVLKEVIQSPAHDLYLVEGQDGRSHLVPAVHEYVPEIDIANKRVVIILPQMDDEEE